MLPEKEIIAVADPVLLTVLPGTDKQGRPESLAQLEITPGQSIAVIGPTGSGKSELLADIQQLANRDTVTGRTVLVNGQEPGALDSAASMVAHLSQKNNFVMDGAVSLFLELHAQSRGLSDPQIPGQTLEAANQLCGEPIAWEDSLQVLSGGQSRALMIADIAFISDSPVVLIDEIENAGLDKFKALEVLTASNKPLLIATHDPVLILMTAQRLVMQGGAMKTLMRTSAEELQCLERLRQVDQLLDRARNRLRQGQSLEAKEFEA